MAGEALFSRAWRPRILIAATVGAVAGAVWLALLVVHLRNDAGERLRAAHLRAAAQAERITAAISARLGAIVPLVDALAADLQSGALSRAGVEARLEADFAAADRADLLEIGVAYAPGPEAGRDAPHFGIKDATARHFRIEESYDYLEYDWYRHARHGAQWSEPYLGGATGAWAAGYLRAFERDGEFAGVARANFSLAEIHRMLALHSDEAMRTLGDTGYAVLLSEDGRIIAHPVDALIGQAAADANDPIVSLVARLDDGGHARHFDEVTGETLWVFADQLAVSDWTAAVVFSEREILALGGGGVRHFYEPLIYASLILLLSLAVLAARAHRGDERALWRVSWLASLSFSAAIVSVWVLSLGGPPRVEGDDIRVADRTAVAALLDARGVPPAARRLPTGVFVQSLRFTSANNVMLTGYVWQRAAGDAPLPGVILPEAEEVEIVEVEPGLWYFETTLRQQFDYSRYPFDHEDVWIRLWPGDLGHFKQTVALVPDFAGYAAQRPEDLPGLEGNFVLEGWELTESHFSYRENRYNARFGLGPEFAGDRALELYFDIGLKRDFLSPFIADFIPIIVVALLAFKVLMSSTRRESRLGLSGFSASAVLGYCAALFFVLIVAHIHLRETLQSAGIIYIEWFYFALYFALLAVSTNAIVFASDANAPLVHFRDNLLTKLVYWPVLTALLFAVTVVVF